MSGDPLYLYRPVDFVATASDCTAPVYDQHRSRLFRGGTFFRSRKQGKDCNNITVQATLELQAKYSFKATLIVRKDENELERFYGAQLQDPFTGGIYTSAIPVLRTKVNAFSKLIEMPERAFDVFDTNGIDAEALTAFGESRLSGGDGPPGSDTELVNIRTGPSRSVVVVRSVEEYDGSPTDPPENARVLEWNGAEWINYSRFT